MKSKLNYILAVGILALLVIVTINPLKSVKANPKWEPCEFFHPNLQECDVPAVNCYCIIVEVEKE